MTPSSPAAHPPAGLPGLRPEWSRLVTAVDSTGVERTWHVLDNGVVDPVATIVCVHGNPTWSYLWRTILETAPVGWRVVAVDHLDMGFSERTGTLRRLGQRVDDLCTLTDALDVRGPVVSLAHDWGGPISLGWALRHLDSLVGVILTNTAVHQPAGSPAPSLIRLVRSRPMLSAVTVRTPTFVRGTLALSRPRPPRAVREAFEAPYRTADRRHAIGEFVADIPLDPSHPSAAALDGIAGGLGALADVPVLLLWGPRDPVFSDLYLRDFLVRLPHAEVHRFEGASHLVQEDADVAGAVRAWVGDLPLDRHHVVDEVTPPRSTGTGRPLWAAIDDRRGDDAPAIVEMDGDSVSAQVTFAEFAADVDALAAGLAVHGVQAGDRVALLVPPGIDLATAVYACWRRGASVVIADAGLGARGISTALRSAAPRHIIGIPRALAASLALRWPGARIAAGELSPTQRRALGVHTSTDELIAFGRTAHVPPGPADDVEAAVLFTSGATGPAKGVVYRHAQLQRQRDALVDTYQVLHDDRLVAAFAPFALYGPAMGITSVVPDMDVTAPATLTATALAGAVAAVDATLVFASPAALVNVVATASSLSATQRAALSGVRTIMSAGAPVPAEVLRAASALMGGAEAHTPYGMTEALPVADITLAEIDALSPDAGGRAGGVCVGHPVPGVAIAIAVLDATGAAVAPLDTAQPLPPGTTGEICVRAPHAKDGYDRLWVTERDASRDDGWHRTGDVGHLDDQGRLWVEGRLGHVVATDTGVVTPVGVERAVETSVAEVQSAALVGVGPVGTQQTVLVVVPTADLPRHGRVASPALSDAVRAVAEPFIGRGVAAVLEVPCLPVDIRHNSKIDRTRLAAWAAELLSGGRVRGLLPARAGRSRR